MWNEWTIGGLIVFAVFVLFFGGWKIIKPRRDKRQHAHREE